MTPSLELQLDRFAELIRRVGPEPLFAAPLVTPADSWFPDRWSPDLESVRRILLRLAEYAGLPEIEVEVETDSETAETQVGDSVLAPGKNYVRMFHGFHDGRAWFAIDPEMLERPDHLVGVLAHEMAHAWREVRIAPFADTDAVAIRTEKERTDLTTVVLGFGILFCNVAYEYRSQGTRAGLYRTQYSHSKFGDLELPDLAGLLACWATLKELSADAILPHLALTQAEDFRKAWDQLTEIDLFERLGISEIPDVQASIPKRASRREFTPSLASQGVHECVKRLVEVAGDDGGLAPGAVPFPVPLLALPHRMLATWGRIDGRQIWTRSLGLVADPEWDTRAVVIVAGEGDVLRRTAVGHIRDRQARDARRLAEWLAPLFASESTFRTIIAPSLPTFVTLVDPPKGFGEGQLQWLFGSIADAADPNQVASETEWLRKHLGHTQTRLEVERAGEIPLVSAGGRADRGRWWKAVTDPTHVRDELAGVPLYRSTRWYKRPKSPHDAASAAAGATTGDEGGVS